MKTRARPPAANADAPRATNTKGVQAEGTGRAFLTKSLTQTPHGLHTDRRGVRPSHNTHPSPRRRCPACRRVFLPFWSPRFGDIVIRCSACGHAGARATFAVAGGAR